MNYLSYDNMAELLPSLAAKIGGGSGASIKDWVASTTYAVGNLVIYQNSLYKCITANNDSTFDETKWQEIGGGVDLPEWQQNTSYTAGEYLVHDGTVYTVVTDFTSGTTFSDTDLTPYISPIMQGATSSANGEAGMVIKPTTADITKFLCGDGTWKAIGGSGVNVIGDILFDTATQILDNTIINLSKPYTDYDYLLIEKIGSAYDLIWVEIGEIAKTIICAARPDNVSFSFDLLSTTQLKIYDVTDSSSSSRLYRITGIKFINSNVYSTTEQRIGTWIDGKPLYQVTVTGTTPSMAGEAGEISLVNLGATYNVKQTVDISGYLLVSNSACWPINGGVGYTAHVRMNIVKNLVIQATSESLSIPIFVTIKYTKTTD